MARHVLLAAALAAVTLRLTAAQVDQCDDEYECEYRTPGTFGYFYDLRPLCNQAQPYTHMDENGTTYVFTVCGNVNVDCNPPYSVIYHRGVAVQFFGKEPPEGQMCTNAQGASVPCTRDCEVLGVGPPIITEHDTSKPKTGVNVTHFGVAAARGDNFDCPVVAPFNVPGDREMTISVLCDESADMKPVIVSAREVEKCRYHIVMKSKHGCGCLPNCINKNCGDDRCGGSCGAVGWNGECPVGTCINGECCVPNCGCPAGGGQCARQCGDDGCGGTCGACGGDQLCNLYQQCVSSNIQPSPDPLLPTTYISTTTGSEKFGAFLGGVIAVGVATLGVSYYMRLRRNYSAVR